MYVQLQDSIQALNLMQLAKFNPMDKHLKTVAITVLAVTILVSVPAVVQGIPVGQQPAASSHQTELIQTTVKV